VPYFTNTGKYTNKEVGSILGIARVTANRYIKMGRELGMVKDKKSKMDVA
jgi:Fic family protein